MSGCSVLLRFDLQATLTNKAFQVLSKRLGIRFEVLDGHSEEIYALQRWAGLTFKPGAAGVQDGPGRRDCQVVCRTIQSG
jgi:hypothetical protein